MPPESYTRYIKRQRVAIAFLLIGTGIIYFLSIASPLRSLREEMSARSTVIGVNGAFDNMKQSTIQFQFPAVQERVEYYMGSWMNDTSARGPYYLSLLRPEYCSQDPTVKGRNQGTMILGLEAVSKCVDADEEIDRSLKNYCQDVLPLLVDPTTYTLRPRTYDLKVLTRASDGSRNLKVPIVSKARQVRAKHESENILWPFKAFRHYHFLFDERKQLQSVSWKEKRDTLLWRGALTGHRLEFVEQLFSYDAEDIDVAFTKVSTKGDPEQRIRGEKFVRPEMQVRDMVKYKYLLSLEGNDVSSGLKWMLWSNSVVFMARPTQVSWAMEDILVPFVHYIPVNDDHSNVFEMLEWARQHQKECQRIAARATEYIEDLILSDKAREENEEILKRIRIIYQKNFGKQLYKYCKEFEDVDVVR